MLGILLYCISVVIVFGGYISQTACRKRKPKIASLILLLSLLCWCYAELRACGLIIYPDDKQFFLHGAEHLNHGTTIAFFFAPYCIGNVIAFIRNKIQSPK